MEPEDSHNVDEIRTNIQKLRDSLNLIDSQKEEWFKKKTDIGKEIRSLIDQARHSKEQRNSLTDFVKKAKEERQQVVADLREKSRLLRQLQDEKESVIKKHNLKGNPSFIKEEIAKLEYQLETSVMSFEKEQQLMKKIKDLQKQYKEFSSISKVWEQIRDLTRDVRSLKKSADDSHRKVQHTAKESQDFHEKILSSGKSIDELKLQEDEAQKKFLECKDQFTEVNAKLKDNLMLLNELTQKQSVAKETKKKQKFDSMMSVLKSKEEVVNEKIRRGEKLTTEDLLIIQRSEQDL